MLLPFVHADRGGMPDSSSSNAPISSADNVQHMSDSEREEAAIAAVQRAFAASKGQSGADKPGAEKTTSAATATTATASAGRQLDQSKHVSAAQGHREKPGSHGRASELGKPAEPDDDHVQPSERWDGEQAKPCL